MSMTFDAPVVGAAATTTAFVFACGDGAFRRVAETETRLDGHRGVSLSLATTGASAISGGDDGRLLEIGDDGVREFATLKGWINAIAVAPETGLVAAAAGRRVQIYNSSGAAVAAFDHPSTVAALAFDPKGKKVVAAHYNGVSVWMAASATATRKALDWKGSHVGVIWSPCGRFIVTTMQENAVHGWRIEDGADFRMDGYPMRVKSAAF
ncbi:MAG: WD40 repeat domain-containing protein, partial [Parvularculaceae bacterium]|nr:WD40 repeat domain-containing protein [Parvularculaceae bacterium]